VSDVGAQFNISKFVFAHGRKPRGYASWAFVPADYYWRGDIPEDGIAWMHGYYSEVKRDLCKAYPQIDTWEVLT